jgi:prophage antirepressor-like protein
MPNLIQFEETQLEILERDGELWFIGADVGRALGYAQPQISVSTLYKRHAHQFSDEETTITSLIMVENEPPRNTRVFSRRGMHRLALYAKTKRAEVFQKWVLDLLEGKVKLPGTAELTPLQQTILENAPNWRDVYEMAQAGRTWAEISKELLMPILDVRALEAALSEWDFHIPDREQPVALGPGDEERIQKLRHCALIEEPKGPKP